MLLLVNNLSPINEVKHVDAIYLDIAKVFDKLPLVRLDKSSKHVVLTWIQICFQVKEKRWAYVTIILAGRQC